MRYDKSLPPENQERWTHVANALPCNGSPAGRCSNGDWCPISLPGPSRNSPDHGSPSGGDGPVRDLRNLLWASIDNDDSRDLDQLTVAEALPGGAVKILVAVADVDALVKKGSAIDEHARHNTTSVYTAAEIFPMLPEKLSTDLTSLNFQEDRLAIVIEMVIGADGSLRGSDIYRATSATRPSWPTTAWRPGWRGRGPMPGPVAAVEGLDENLRLQDRVAQKLKAFRHEHGALDLETIEARPVFDGEGIRDLEAERKNRAKELIEDFMIAANGVTARYPRWRGNSLPAAGGPLPRSAGTGSSRWPRSTAFTFHGARPEGPGEFPGAPKAADPLRFPDLSLTIIKLMGRGEYVVELPGEEAPGHFGLAVRDYTHSTAPNRRYPDLITQRLLKAALAGSPPAIWTRGTGGAGPPLHREGGRREQGRTAGREVGGGHAARIEDRGAVRRHRHRCLGQGHLGASSHPPVEGKLIHGFEGADVGHRVRVQLVHTDVDRGYIDFKKVD